ncbi:hypothetical protein EQM05_12090 [Clostridium sp. JN-9]|nr:hypothetical protein EQM05_12090 [Clostridium sp. JN-9]
MKIKINLWAFIFSFICVALFFISVSSPDIINLLHVHPLNIVLCISFITFIFGLIGFSASTSWILLLRSILTTVITLCLSLFILYILVVGNLFKFT